MGALQKAMEDEGPGAFAPPGHPDRGLEPAPTPSGPIERIRRVCDDAAETIVLQAKTVVGQAEEYLREAEVFARDVRQIGDAHARRLEEFGLRMQDALATLKEQQRLLGNAENVSKDVPDLMRKA